MFHQINWTEVGMVVAGMIAFLGYCIMKVGDDTQVSTSMNDWKRDV